MKNHLHTSSTIEAAINVVCLLTLLACFSVLITLQASIPAGAQIGCAYPPLLPNPHE